MSVQLPSINLVGAKTGQTGGIDLSQLRLSALPRPPLSQSMGNDYAHLLLLNHSHCLLDIAFAGGSYGTNSPVPANGPAVIAIPAGATSAVWTVAQALAGSLTGTCAVYFYDIYEPVDITQFGGGTYGNNTQQRNVSIPGAVFAANGTWVVSTTTPLIVTATNLTPTNIAAKQVNCYLLYAGLTVGISGAAAHLVVDLSIDCVLSTTSTGTVLVGSPAVLWRDELWSDTTSGIDVSNGRSLIFPTFAILQQLTWSSGSPLWVLFRLVGNGIIGAPQIFFNLGGATDPTNLSNPGAYGLPSVNTLGRLEVY